MHAGHIQAELLRANLLRVAAPMADAEYDAPQSSWLTGEFYSWYRTVLAAFGSHLYVKESWDCDNYADAFKLLADIAHRRMGRTTGLAVGVLFYTQDAGGGHAINCAVTPDLGLVFIEPQTGSLLQLSPNERASACLVRF